MASIDYTAFKYGLGRGRFALQSDTLKCVLLTNAHAPSAADAVLADVVADEASGAGYTAGGATLSSVTWTATGTSLALDAADPSWTTATITARYAVVYAAKTVDGVTNPLIALLDFGADKGVTGGTFSVQIDAAGIVTVD